jgi:hypothetical protein
VKRLLTPQLKYKAGKPVADLQGGLGGHVPGPGGPRGPLRAPEKYAEGAARRRGQWAQGLFGRWAEKNYGAPGLLGPTQLVL